MSLLEKLPTEVRQVIWEECLVINETINPWPTSREVLLAARHRTFLPNCTSNLPRGSLVKVGSAKYRPPFSCMALLAVNKLIRHESLCVFLGHNEWRLSPHDRRSKIMSMHYPFFRRISLKCTMYDANFAAQVLYCRRGHRLAEIEGGIPNDLLNNELSSGEENCREFHSFAMACQDRCFTNQLQHMWDMNPVKLHFDVTQLYCPIGCCRIRPLRRLMGEAFSGDVVPLSILREKVQIDSERMRDVPEAGLPRFKIEAKAPNGHTTIITGLQNADKRDEIVRFMQLDPATRPDYLYHAYRVET